MLANTVSQVNKVEHRPTQLRTRGVGEHSQIQLVENPDEISRTK